MKKFFLKVICFTIILSLIPASIVLSEDFPASIHLGAISVVDAGQEAVLTIDITINSNHDIQGAQIDFGFSDNFPKLKKTEIIKNTTGWENVGVTHHNLLAIGNVITEKSQIVAKITFDVPKDAAFGTEYVFSIEDAVVASATQEFSAKLNTESLKIVVSGVAPRPEIKPDESDEKNNDSVVENPSTSTGTTSPSKDSESDLQDDKVAEKPAPWKNPFSDVEESDWFYDGIRFAFENELMSGVGAGIFSPNSTLTRAMLVTILYRLEGAPKSMTYAFSDVARNTWYTKSVDWAASSGIVNGIGNNMFAPENPVTREQITVIFYNYTKYKEMDLSAKRALSDYEDAQQISPWAATAFEWAVASELVGGRGDGTLDPKGNATRAETAAIIKRYVENINRK